MGAYAQYVCCMYVCMALCLAKQEKIFKRREQYKKNNNNNSNNIKKEKH